MCVLEGDRERERKGRKTRIEIGRERGSTLNSALKRRSRGVEERRGSTKKRREWVGLGGGERDLAARPFWRTASTGGRFESPGH